MILHCHSMGWARPVVGVDRVDPVRRISSRRGRQRCRPRSVPTQTRKIEQTAIKGSVPLLVSRGDRETLSSRRKGRGHVTGGRSPGGTALSSPDAATGFACSSKEMRRRPRLSVPLRPPPGGGAPLRSSSTDSASPRVGHPLVWHPPSPPCSKRTGRSSTAMASFPMHRR